ncbi:hypothetical protein [Streptomyces sp. NPDC056464]|uniref:hypothetical protein n=1 Tax=Streptomyces sp. NPDC056464 TaxID=3345828 RepID=UPI003699581E
MGRDAGVPRLRLVVVTDDAAGPAAVPWVRRSADASVEGDGGVLLVGVPVAALAADAAGEGEDPGGTSRSDLHLP